MKKLSSITLWVLMLVSVVMLVLFFMAETTNEQLSNGQFQEVSTFLDPFLYWAYFVVGLGIILLIVFAFKTFATDPKAGIAGLIGIALFVGLLAICYLISPAEGFERVVNGETEVYTESTMKMIDMWLYSMYVLIGLPVILVVLFGAKRAIIK